MFCRSGLQQSRKLPLSSSAPTKRFAPRVYAPWGQGHGDFRPLSLQLVSSLPEGLKSALRRLEDARRAFNLPDGPFVATEVITPTCALKPNFIYPETLRRFRTQVEIYDGRFIRGFVEIGEEDRFLTPAEAEHVQRASHSKSTRQ